MDCKHEFIEFRIHSKITDIRSKCGHIVMGVRNIEPDELKREIDIRMDYER
ncbi:hypothetical protein [Bacillus toyonensis]|uniref:hypothetical protein n=1 Tax=Bacillus toyonensis TaxID=155322 RepID=UPI0015D476F6|nr:hypothetical protein [Bacillus toyonensis]